MFTGIIEALGTLERISGDGTNRTFWIKSDISGELKIDESLCHDGICLTIEEILNNSHRVTAIRETLDKTNAGLWKEGDMLNLERSLKLNDRLDGHIVQGHVDGTAICIAKDDVKGSFEYTFRFDTAQAALIIEKGSICLNGISLTAYNVTRDTFTVAIIPYTFEHTNMQYIHPGKVVNIEFDMIGKYVYRLQSLQ